MNGADAMYGSYLGPTFSAEQIRGELDAFSASYVELQDDELFAQLARILDEENVVGWFQGRMEFGPRALGGRSIIGDPRSAKMQSVMNLKIKYRESFRPFAPSVLAERVSDYFEQTAPSPYMLIVAPVQAALRIPMTEEQKGMNGIELLNTKRSELPAITHVDYSARIQTVHPETNPRYHQAFGGLRSPHGMRRASEHVLQRPRRAHRVHAHRCLSVLHAHRDGLPGGGEFPPEEGRSAPLGEGRQLAGRVRARLMSLAHDIPEIDRKGLREFAFILGGAVAVIFGLLLPWLFERSYPLWPWVFLGVFAVWGLLAPNTLRPVYRIWMRFGLLLNKVTTPLVLGVVFFLLILPVGLVRRALGKDSIPKRAEPEKDSYRVASDAIPKESLERPF